MRVYAAPRPQRLRVRLYPQSPGGGGVQRLDTVLLSVRVGEVGPGPSDDRIYTIDAPTKRPYGNPQREGSRALPPWAGPVAPPAMPGPDGHFDHFTPEHPRFRQVHLYGCVRFALDVWEKYIGRPIPWHFTRGYDRLELVALRGWANAHMGYGYLEAGERLLPDGLVADLALDFDVIAHELGHALLLAFGGPFNPDRVTPEYEAFHEASADWASMIAVLHFRPLIEELMESCRGDLDTSNRLSRFAEFSSSKQVRLANNDRTMWDFVRGWSSVHELSQPLLAALWDGFVEVYNEILVNRHAIPRAVERLAEEAELNDRLRPVAMREFAKAFQRRPDPFYDAIIEAREIAASFLIDLWHRVDPTSFRFSDIAPLLAETDRRRFGGHLRKLVAGRLAIRGVGIVPPGPRLTPRSASNHLHSERMAMPF